MIPTQIICYPRSGLTWVRFFCQKMNIGIKRNQWLRASEQVGFSHDGMGLPPLKSRPKPNSDYYINRSRFRQLIFLSRDPRDVIVSNYFRMVGMGNFAHKRNDFGAFVRDGNFGIACMVKWLICWADIWSKWQSPKIMMAYEDRVENPVREFARFVEFIDFPTTSEKLRRAVELSSFAKMKGIEKDKGQLFRDMRSFKHRNVTGNPANAMIVRKGEVGGYRGILRGDLLDFVNEQLSRLPDPFDRYRE